jgi:ABC-type bacteriocin/lantibiotic exporter with double-glycine peptidase domain
VATVAGVVLFFAPFAAERALRASHPPNLLAVPLVSQARPWTCGGASLMAALLYFGVFDDTESRLDDDLGATPERGTSVVSLVAEGRRFGLSAEARTGLTLTDLDREVARGAIVIVALQAWATHPVADWRANWEDGHYVVIAGLVADRVYVMDPSVRTGYAYLTREQFLERWHDYDQEGEQRVVYDRLGIVIRGEKGLARYPADPVPVE